MYGKSQGVMKVILDSDFLITLMDEKDKYNKDSLYVLHALQKVPHVEIIMDCVINEVISMLSRRYGGEGGEGDFHRALSLIEEKIPKARIIWIYPKVPELYDGVIKVMKKYRGKLNFHDAMIVIMMLNSNIEYIISLDKDFDAVDGIKRIDPAKIDQFVGGRR